MVKNLPVYARNSKSRVQSLDWRDPREGEMATCSSILAWEIPWTEEPGSAKSWTCLREHAHTHTHTHTRTHTRQL